MGFTSVCDYQDGLLTKLVSSANKELFVQLPLHITLFIKGQMIVGQLISGNEYYQCLADELRKMSSSEANRLASEMSLKGEKTYKAYNGESFEDPETAYIHLKNVKIIDQKGETLAEQLWWRGKIVSVDGFAWQVAE